MYCPRCATPNADGAKFCRSCGTELEAVALALSGKSAPPASVGANKVESGGGESLERQGRGVREITEGATLLTVSLLMAVPLALFLPSSFDAPWILVWMVFFGWMACWGGIKIGNGISSTLESKSRLPPAGAPVKGRAVDSTQRQLSYDGEPPAGAIPPAAFGSSTPLSVTEGTTRHLDDATGK